MPDSTTIHKRSGVILLAIALLSATVLMLPVLAESPLLLDEHVSYWIAGPDNPGTLWTRSVNYAATPPLSSVMQRTALQCGGESTRVFRAPSAICFLAAIVGVYFTGTALRHEILGGAAALLLAWHPEVVDWMRVARPYGLSTALAAWGLWCTVRWARQPQSVKWIVAWTVVNAALVWTHYLNLPLVLLQAATLCGWRWFRLTGQSCAVRRIWPASAVMVLLLSPLWPACRRIAEWAPVLNYRQTPPSLSEMIGPMWWAGLPLGLATAVLLSARWKRGEAPTAEASQTKDVRVLFLWGLAPLILLAVGAAVSSPTLGESRYRIVYAPAGCLLIASLLTNVLPRLATCREAATCGTLLPAAVVTLAAAWWPSGLLPWRSQLLSAPAAPDWEALAGELNTLGHEGEPVFVGSGLIEQRLVPVFYSDPLFMDYVGCRLGRFYVKAPHTRNALPWVWAPTRDLTAFYQHELSTSSDEANEVVWVAAGIDTDLGRGSLEGFSTLLRSSGYQETGRWQKSTAVLVRFRRTGSEVPG